MFKKYILMTSLLTLMGCEGGGDSDPLNALSSEVAIATIPSTGEEVRYQVMNGLAILGGDIVLGTHAEVQANGIEPIAIPTGVSSTICNDSEVECAAITSQSSRVWKNGVIPFTLASNLQNGVDEEIFKAMDEWESNTAITFVKRNGESDYVEFRGPNNGPACNSNIGKKGGKQQVHITKGRNCVAHEIGHVVGLGHEHNRSDRDTYIKIDLNNVASANHGQFDKNTNSNNMDNVGTYDIKSVMHYDAYIGAKDSSKPVITSKKGVRTANIGGAAGGKLTDGDIAGVSSVYGSGITKYYSFRKANSSNYAIDGGSLAGSENKSNISIYRYTSSNRNQHWEEIKRGDYYSYRRKFTSLCIDGNAGGRNDQNVYLYQCESGNQNQQWKKYNNGFHTRLQKRNKSGFSIDGGSNGSNGQNLKLYKSSDDNGNQNWSITRQRP